jgi:thiol-disulfide isomerase/thioredoxin
MHRLKIILKTIFSFKGFSLLFNIFFTVFVVYRLSERIPKAIDHYQMENQFLPEFQIPLLDGNNLNSQSWSQKKILDFWATWCGPCKLELSRLNKLIEDGKIKDPSSIVAISSFEEVNLVTKEAHDRAYRFTIGLDQNGSMSQEFKISGTPTIIFVDQNKKIDWITTGISPSLELRTLDFLGSSNPK